MRIGDESDIGAHEPAETLSGELLLLTMPCHGGTILLTIALFLFLRVVLSSTCRCMIDTMVCVCWGVLDLRDWRMF